jgi:hypothetical protein
MLERRVCERDATFGSETAREATVLVRQRPPDHGTHLVVGQWLQPPDTKAGQEGRVDLEVRVLGGRTNERHGAVFDVRQESVLLGLVEAMDLVDEQDRAPAVERQPILCFRDQRPDLGDARHDRGQGGELRPDRIGEQSCEARLAGARWPPQEDGREVTPFDRAAERAPFADQVLLAHELVERPRTHPGGQWLPLRRWPEQGLGSGSAGTGRGAARGHGPNGSDRVPDTVRVSLEPDRSSSRRIGVRSVVRR